MGSSESRAGSLRVLFLGASVILTALLARTWGGLDHYPGFISGDEVAAALEARELIDIRDPSTWTEAWVTGGGLMRTTLVPLRAAQVVFGDNLAGTRMAHALLGVITVAAFFGFARRFADDWTGWIAAMMLAVSHVHVHFSRTHGTWGIQSATGMALILWGAIRARDASSRAAWLCWSALTGLFLGWAVQTFQNAFPFPIFLLITLWFWRRDMKFSWWRTAMVIIVCAVPLCAHWAWWYYSHYPESFEHVATQNIFSASYRAQVGEPWARMAFDRTVECLLFWWHGQDQLEHYHASIAALDPVSSALFAGGLLLAAWQWRSQLTWLAALWVPPLLMSGVIMSVYPPSYHRMTAPIMLILLLSANFLTTVTRRLPPVWDRVVGIALLVMIGGYNMNYVFRRFPAEIESDPKHQALVRAYDLCRAGTDWRSIDSATDNYLQMIVRLQCGAKVTRESHG